MAKLSAAQLARLQTLYAQYARRAIDLDNSRECRLRWASQELGVAVTSFGALEKSQATALIDLLQGAMGIPPTKKARRPRREDRAAGTEGRHDGDAKLTTMPRAEDIERIQQALARLGWSTAQYEGWLRSPRSPLAQKMGGVRIAPNDITIRTLRDANRVWWALKGMLKQRRLWTV